MIKFTMLSVLLLVSSFLLGSVPCGVLLARAFGLKDPRQFGSGNIGAANLSRLGGRRLGVLTFLCDFLKGSVPALIALFLFPEDSWLAPASAVLAVAGHCYSIFLSFDGGKGVATTAGALLVLYPTAILAGLFVWILVFLLEKTSSLAAMLALPAILITLVWRGADSSTILAAVLCVLIVVRRHTTNLVDLLNSSERSFEESQKK